MVKRDMLRAALLFVAVATAAAAAGEKTDRQLMAILKFDVDKTVTDSAREAMEESLRNMASEKAPGYTVLDGKTQLQILEDSGIDPSKACAGSCALDVARQLQAKVFLSGSIRRPDKLYRAFVRCYLSADGSVLGSIQITGVSIDELLGQVEQQSEKLFGRLPGVILQAPPQQQDGNAAISARGSTPAAAGPGFITIITQPKANVMLDGDPVGQTPLRRRQVEAGSHLIVLTAPGYAARSRTVDVPSGREVSVTETLQNEEGGLEIDVNPPGARLFIDNKPARAGVNPGLAIGQHTVRAEAPGYRVTEQTASVDNGQNTRVSLVMSPLPGKIVVMANVSANCRVGAGGPREVRPDAPVSFEADAGEHMVSCTRDGFTGFSESRSVPAGKSVVVQAKLTRASGGESQLDTKSSTVFVHIPGGTFTMGCLPSDYQCYTDEKPSRLVTVRDFWLARTETTVADWEKCVSAGVCSGAGRTRDIAATKTCNWNNGRSSYPINCISQIEAAQFCRWVGGRLPISEEFEYVAKGGSENRLYPWGSTPPDGTQANYCDVNCPSRLGAAMLKQWTDNNWIDREHNDGYASTAPVGSFPRGASRWGLLDIAGNVWEWTSNDHGDKKEVKGGGWVAVRAQLRSSARQRNAADYNDDGTGVRCAR